MSFAPPAPATRPAPALPLALRLVEAHSTAADGRPADAPTPPTHADSYGCYSCGCEVATSVQAQAAGHAPA